MSVHGGVPGLKESGPWGWGGGSWSRGVRGGDGYCCGRYSSYWNAFLFPIIFVPFEISFKSTYSFAQTHSVVVINKIGRCVYSGGSRISPRRGRQLPGGAANI